MKKIILLITVSGIVFNLFAEDTIYGGDVFGTWTASNSPFFIVGDISVPESEVLIIEPGVQVIFKGYYGLYVSKANLIAVGTPDSTIIFTMDPADTTGFANGADNEGGWKGLYFSGQSLFKCS